MPQPDTRRGRPLEPPAGGWPDHPIWADIPAIARWLMPEERNATGSVVIASRQDAARFIRGVALELLAELRATESSPTRRDALEQLDQIAELAKKLGDILHTPRMTERLDKARPGQQPRVLVRGWANPTGLTQDVALDVMFLQRVPRGTGYELVQWDTILAKPLRSLAEHARRQRRVIEARSGGGAGRKNLYERMCGDPRTRLARGCAWVLRETRGSNGAHATAELVQKLAEMIWTAATGEAAPPDALRPYAIAAARAEAKEASRRPNDG